MMVKPRLARDLSRLPYQAATGINNGFDRPDLNKVADSCRIPIRSKAGGHKSEKQVRDRLAGKNSQALRPRARVAFLGCGTVGAEVLAGLIQRPDLFEVNPVLVRNPGRHAGEDRCKFTSNAADAMRGDPDILIELIGGTDYPAGLMCSALRKGVHVVTANKAAVATYYDALHSSAQEGCATLRYSGAIGGGAPILETLDRLRERDGIQRIEGVLSGRVNFLLDRLCAGSTLEAALASSRRLGLDSANPDSALNGLDAAARLSILIRRAFGVGACGMARQSLLEFDQERVEMACARGDVVRQIVRCSRSRTGMPNAEVRIEALPADHPLVEASFQESRFLVTDGGGGVHLVPGRAQGCSQAAASVLEDVMEVRDSLTSAGA